MPCSVCGTLTNFTADASLRPALLALGCVARLVDVLTRCMSLDELTDMEVDMVAVVCKALSNLCADDAALGAPLATSPALSEAEVAALGELLEHVQECEGLMAASEEIPQVGGVVGLGEVAGVLSGGVGSAGGV